MKRFQIALACLACCSVCFADTVEELRIARAETAFGNTLNPATFDGNSREALLDQAERKGRHLWKEATRSARSAQKPDDRPLYWQRLAASRALKQQTGARSTIERFEEASRGRLDLDFTSDADKRILLTGFDPFFLDRDIYQSNPSGIVALALDGRVIEHGGISGEIQTVVFPVRFEDFDQGELEALLAPIYKLGSVDLIVTVSMGREGFDLERFPGRRRSAAAPDNLNVLTGATADRPMVPSLNGRELAGPEFVEFSLPADAMRRARGPYPIHDNRTVTTLAGTFEAGSLERLQDTVAVRGSGGGYLSNEISYRSIRLRNQLGSTIPTGHIHVPAVRGYDAEAASAILSQITSMLELALAEL